MVKLTQDQQRRWVSSHPTAFAPIPGGWGDKGCTQVFLRHARVDWVREVMRLAWQNVAPKRLVQRWMDDEPSDRSRK